MKNIVSPGMRIYVICALYILFTLIVSTEKLNGDEFGQISQPYEMLGGDYTVGYLKEGNYQKAAGTIFKSYFLYWQYRPLFSPIVDEKHQALFREEEEKFGYVKPESVKRGAPDSLLKYKKRQVVPEPDRFYMHGAGKPLLPQILSIPQLALIELTSGGRELLNLQFTRQHHPLFILTRLVQLISGLVSIILVYLLLKKGTDPDLASLGAAIFAFFPVSIEFFPDIHNDAIMLPFIIGASYFLINGKVVKGGVAYGLALASKNVAIFLLPAFVMFYAWRAFEVRRETNGQESKRYLLEKVRELVIFGFISLVILTPFANPKSYAEEILTPITNREYDPRGQKVGDFTLSGRLGVAEEYEEISPPKKVLSGIVGILNVRGFNSNFIYFAILGFFLCFAAAKKDRTKLSLMMLLMTLPAGLVFQYAIMTYRSLIFLPFFAVLCTDLLERRHLVILSWMLFASALIWTLNSALT